MIDLLISIVTYNNANIIKETIKSIINQTMGISYKIIIYDNNSTDDTVAIVASYPVTLLHERNVQTSYAARNTGIRGAAGEIVAFTDADCLPEAGWLAHLAIGFGAPSVVGLAGALRPASPVGLVDAFLVERSPVRSRKIEGAWYVVTANAAYRRSTLLQIGMFDQRLFTGGDLDLSLRIQTGGWGRIEEAPEAIVIHKFENSWRGLWARYRRYGYAQRLVSALFPGQLAEPFAAAERHRRLLRQLRSLLIYPLSFLWRLRRVLLKGWNAPYNLAPLLSLTVEVASLWGQLRASVEIRWHSDRLPEPRRFPQGSAAAEWLRPSEA